MVTFFSVKVHVKVVYLKIIAQVAFKVYKMSYTVLKVNV